MNRRYRVVMMILCGMTFLPFTTASAGEDTFRNHESHHRGTFRPHDDPLKILEPIERQTFNSSNITIVVRFGFDMQADPKEFHATLNGKPVGSLFVFADREQYVAKALLSIKDGLHASEKGSRMNVFAAEVEGPDGFKYRQIVRFTVDCSGNHAPVAQVIAKDDKVFAHEFVQLDGSGSSDADGDPLAYNWSFVTKPRKSRAVFSDPSAVKPSFIPDVPGTYVARFVVHDYKADSEPKTVTIEADELKILIERPVYDRIFEIISKNGIVTQSDAIEDIRSHHLAIIDGNGLTADEIRNSKLLKEALGEGKWGLVLNVTEEHKSAGLTPHLGIVSRNTAKALLFRRLNDGNTPVFRILELPSIDAAAIPDRHHHDPERCAPQWGWHRDHDDQDCTETKPDIFARYAGILLKKLRESMGNDSGLGSAPPPDNSIPPDLINVRWDYSNVLPFSFDHSGRQSVTKGRIQHGSYIANHTFTLFLDNGNNATGNKQYLLLQVDTNSNPNDPTSDWMASDGDMDKHNEYAWFQDYITVSAAPVEADPLNPKWLWVNNDPSSPNNLTTYSANASFSVGFNQAQGILGSFSCGFGTSYTLADWGALCDACSGASMTWKYHSTNPPEHSGSYFGYWDMYDWYYGLGKPKRPNSICMGQEIFHAAVVWNTGNKLLTDPVADEATIASRIEIDLVDNWCERDLGTTACSKVHTAKTLFSKDLTFVIDPTTVIPIQIESITFDQNPVQVNLGTFTTMKGYVNLASEAKIDTKITNIKADSLNVNAIPRVASIIIPKGAKTGSFEIDVNTNGLSRNQSVTAGISAFYTNTYSYSLTIQAK